MKKIQIGGHRGRSLIRGYTLVDDEDFEYLNQWEWCLLSNGYAVRYANQNQQRKVFLMHREILSPSSKKHVDHINGNKLDNRRKNLRICTPSQNMMNTKKRKDNCSGTTGVSFIKDSKKWRAYINKNKKQIGLGCFKRKSDAVRARKLGELKYFGQFSYVR